MGSPTEQNLPYSGQIPLPAGLLRVADVLRNTGWAEAVYAVGGYVRDWLLYGRAPSGDVDLVCTRSVESLVALLSAAGLVDGEPVVYRRFGVVRVVLRGVACEIALARRESYHTDSRKPVSVEPASLDEDVRRRDFTVNTLLARLSDGRLFDLTGAGLRDLQERVLRTPADPEVSFSDDPLRILRAARFHAQLPVRIHPDVLQAMTGCAHRLRIVSAERLRDEFTKTLCAARSVSGLRRLQETGVLSEIAPELSAMTRAPQNRLTDRTVWEHTLCALETLDADADITLRLAVLLHDVGKPSTAVGDGQSLSFHGHAEAGSVISQEWMTRMRFPGDITQRVSQAVRLHMRVASYTPGWTDGAVRRLVRDAGDVLPLVIDVVRADSQAVGPELANPHLDALEERAEQLRREMGGYRPRIPLTGTDIMRILGVAPGPLVGEVIRYLEDAVIRGDLTAADSEAAAQHIRARWGHS